MGPVQVLVRELRQGCGPSWLGLTGPTGTQSSQGCSFHTLPSAQPCPQHRRQGPWSPQAAAPVCAPRPSRRARAAPRAAPPRRQGCAEAPPTQAQGSGPPLGGASGVLWSTSETRPATGWPAGMRMDPDNESRPQALSPWAMTSSRFFPFSSLMTYGDHNRPLPETPLHAAGLHCAFSGRGGAGRRSAPGEDAPKPAGPPVRRGGFHPHVASPKTRCKGEPGTPATPRDGTAGQVDFTPPRGGKSVRAAP